MENFPVKYKPINLADFTIEQTLKEDDFYRQYTAGLALEAGKIEILDILAEHNIFPAPKAIPRIVWKASPEALDWLIKKDLLAGKVGTKAANAAASWHAFEALDRLANRGILPNHKAFSTFSYDFDDIKKMFDWLTDKQIFPTSREANLAKERNRQDVLSLLETIGVYPDPSLPEKKHACK